MFTTLNFSHIKKITMESSGSLPLLGITITWEIFFKLWEQGPHLQKFRSSVQVWGGGVEGGVPAAVISDFPPVTLMQRKEGHG